MTLKHISSLPAMATLVLGITLAGCGGGSRHDTSTPAPPPTQKVAVVTMATETGPQFVEGVGSVEARTEAQVAARVMGYVQQVHVREGDRVQAGQVLVEIAASELNAAVAQANAARQEAQSASSEVESAIVAATSAARLAEVTFQRMRNLHDRKSISDQEFDEASARHAAAQANLKMAESKRTQIADRVHQASAATDVAKAQLSYLRIRAPFAGVVSARLAEPGDLASPGTPLLRIEKQGEYRLAANFPESVLGTLKVGMVVPVSIDALDWKGDGRVAEIAPIVDASTRTVAVKVALPTQNSVRSGLYGKASAPGGERSVLLIPARAVRSSGQLTTAFVVDGGVARSRMLKLGGERNGASEVLSGLTAGEQVVLRPTDALRDGNPVEVQQ